MKCNFCGTEVPNGHAYCPACGAQQAQQPQQPPQQQYQPQQQNPYQQNSQYQPQYGNQQYGMPQGQYNPQQPQYGNPQQQYGSPQQPYGAPQNQYNPQQGGYNPQQNPYGGQQYQQPNGFVPQAKQENTALVAFSHVPAFFWLGLIDGTPRGKKAATQGLWLLIASIGGSIAFSILTALLALAHIGIIGSVLSWGWSIAILVFSIMGIVKGFGGEDFEVPVLGKFKIFDK